MGDGFSCGGALLNRVCLSLERGFAAMHSGQGECSVQVCLLCWSVQVPFLSVDLLVEFAESGGFCYLRADGYLRTFVEAAVVVGRASIS